MPNHLRQHISQSCKFRLKYNRKIELLNSEKKNKAQITIGFSVNIGYIKDIKTTEKKCMYDKLTAAVNDLDEKLLENHRFDTRLFVELTEIQRENGILHGDRPICPFLRPHFISRRFYNRIENAVETLHPAFIRLTEAALENAEILAEINLTEKEERMARIDPLYSGLCASSRFDTFLCGDDFKFLEYNAETPAGVGDQKAFEKVFEKVPEVQEFLSQNAHYRPQPQESLLKSLVDAYRDSGGKKGKPNIAIVDWEGVSTAPEFYLLKDYFESQGFQTLVTNPYELEYDGKILRVEDFEIDIFYKRVIIHEFLETFDEDHPFTQAYLDGNICMANNFRVKIPHKKTSFAIATDEKYAQIFTNEQREMIRKHIPWTRVVRDSRTTFEGKEIELLEFLRRERERFILKPHDDYGGHGIEIGWEISASQWDDVLENALKNCFIVQERVGVDKISIPTFGETEASMQSLNVDFDPFLFLGKMEGGMVRLASQSLVNITQGGGETALVVLENF